MAWTKVLGKVTGEDGDVYLPDIRIANGYLHYSWERKTAEEAAEIIEHGKDINIPVYMPGEMDENGYVTFSLSETVKGIDGQNLPDRTFKLKGETGQTGATAFKIRPVTETSIENIENPEADTIYVKDTKVWIYDNVEQKFIMLEGLDFSNYYTKSEVYNKTEINSMFNEVASQMELAYRLLEIEETILSEQELGE